MIDTSRLRELANKAFDSLERRNAGLLYKDLEEYLLPSQASNLDVTGTQNTPGRKTTQKIFDITGPTSARELSAILFTMMSPPSKKWSKFRIRDSVLKNNDAVSRYFDEVTERIHQSLLDSNLYRCLGSFYRSYVVYGSAAIIHEEKKRNEDGSYGGVNFSNLHVGQLAWCENNEGIVDEIYRKVQMTARQVCDRWPDTAPQTIKGLLDKDPGTPVVIYNCIYPTHLYKSKRNAFGGYNKDERPYKSVYFDEESGTPLEEEGYNEFPVHVARYETMAGEVVGRGPGHLALPTVVSRNAEERAYHMSLALGLEPPIITEGRNIISNTADLRPSGLTVVRKLKGIQQWSTAARFDIARDKAEDDRMSIRRVFLLDKLLLPPRQETGEMSAFEISRRVEESQRVLGDTPARIEAELLRQMILRQFGIMLRAGALPPVPEELQGLTPDVDIELESQLGRAQRIEEVSATQQWVQHLMLLAQADPSAMDLINVDEAGRHDGRILGVTETSIASDEDVAAKRQARQEQQQQAMEADLNLKNADAQSKLR